MVKPFVPLYFIAIAFIISQIKKSDVETMCKRVFAYNGILDHP